MYARPLFVVVGIFRAFSGEADPGPIRRRILIRSPRAYAG